MLWCQGGGGDHEGRGAEDVWLGLISTYAAHTHTLTTTAMVFTKTASLRALVCFTFAKVPPETPASAVPPEEEEEEEEEAPTNESPFPSIHGL